MIDNLVLWFESHGAQQQFFWVCALVATLLFVIQFVLAVVGLGDADVDADTLDLGGGFSLFTVRNVIHFFMGMGWAGVSLQSLIPNPTVLSLISIGVGILFVWIFFLLVRQLLRLEKSGNYSTQDAVGQVASVYIPIPGNNAGTGKVQLSFNGSVVEMDAVTSGDSIASGVRVRVTEVVGGDTLRVEVV